jgi:hypothetical protein
MGRSVAFTAQTLHDGLASGTFLIVGNAIPNHDFDMIRRDITPADMTASGLPSAIKGAHPLVNHVNPASCCQSIRRDKGQVPCQTENQGDLKIKCCFTRGLSNLVKRYEIGGFCNPADKKASPTVGFYVQAG